MKDDDTIGLLVVGGGVAAASALAWRSMHPAPANATSATPPERAFVATHARSWIYPVPNLGDRRAVISDGFGSPRTRADGSKETHLGADLMYRRRDARDLIAVYPPGSASGTKGYFMPDGVPVLAASAGVVQFAARTPVGHTVILRHASGWATYYTHLSSLTIARGERVAAGQVIGTIGGSPLDRRYLRHLHLEVWQHGTRSSAVDPAPYLAAWSRVEIPSWTPDTTIARAPRNGGLVYRPVGARGEPYPAWVRDLRGQSGVYIIREIGGPIVYVGSSIGRLYETVTRHLQVWRRWKGYWREHQFAEGADPGLTYERSSVEVAIKRTRPDEAHEEELRMIRRLQPRDNQIGQPEPELEEAPF